MATYTLFAALVWVLLGSVTAAAQTLQLFERTTGMTEVEAQIGDVIEVEVQANLGRFAAAGLSLYLSIPYCFEVIDTNPDNEADLRPFRLGPLFEGATEAGNALLSAEELQGMQNDAQMLTYSLVVGPGQDRARSGKGVVARFKLLCVKTADTSQVRITSNPILETRLVLADGWTEQRFTAVKGLAITVQDERTVVEPDFSWGTIKAYATLRAD